MTTDARVIGTLPLPSGAARESATPIDADPQTTEVLASTAPPTRTDRGGSASASARDGGTEVLTPVRVPRLSRALGGGGRPPRRRRGARGRLPLPAPRQKAPRDGRWWAGVVVLTASVLLLSFVAHVAVFSAFQHYRSQTIAYDELRVALAKGTAPVNQIQVEQGKTTEDGTMNPIGTPVALLEAPSIGLSEVVLEGTSSDTLRAGIGHRRDSVIPGQSGKSVVLGRQTTYGGPFSQVYRLAPGDQIRVTTGQGESTYRVLGLRRAGDPAAAGVVWLWRSWGRWQAWLIGLPVVVALGVATADVVMAALPNLL